MPYEVRIAIDGNVSKLGRDDARFFLVNIPPSKKELDFLIAKYGEKEAGEQLKEYAEKVMDASALNFGRDNVRASSDLLWFAKLENFRYYSYKDKQVKDGTKQRGERKDGSQMHVQVIVSRKDITGKIKLSPMNTSRGKNAAHSAKMGQFDRTAFKQSGETIFDSMFGFDRNLKDTIQYANAMKNGSVDEKTELLDRSEAVDRDRESARPLVEDQLWQGSAVTNGGLLDILDDYVRWQDESPSVAEEEERKRKRKRRGRRM